MKNAFVAFFLSLLLPGAGHLYTKAKGAGLVFIVLTLGIECSARWLVTSPDRLVGLGVAVAIITILAAVTAALRARKIASGGGALASPVISLLLAVVLHGGTLYAISQPWLGTITTMQMPNHSMNPLIEKDEPVVIQLGASVGLHELATLVYPSPYLTQEIDRLMALPGDSVQIINDVLYRNGQADDRDPLDLQFRFMLHTTRDVTNYEIWEQYGLKLGAGPTEGGYLVLTNDSVAQKIVDEVEWIGSAERVRPDSGFTNRLLWTGPIPGWNEADFGPVLVPKAGLTVQLDSLGRKVYSRTMRLEDAKIEVRDSVVLRDGEPITEYTFKEDHYFFLSDSRHNGLDSRLWGFVPEEFILGKPLFLWQTPDPERDGMPVK